MSSSSKPRRSKKRKRTRRKRKAFTATVSKIERRVGEVLKSLRYKFQVQYPMFSTTGRCKGIFDFYLDAHKVAIEVNGTFWHSDPRVYPDGPKYKTQRRNAKSWKRKLKQAKQRGIRIIVLWEKDLEEADDIREYIKTVLRDEL